MDKVKKLVKEKKDYIIQLRRDFHMHPELGFDEHRTSKIVAEHMTNLGLKVTTGVNKTGVVALLEGKKPGKTILLRADMDALAVNEENDVPYASTKKGVMHACGHDGHTAVLIGVAQILNEMKDDINGNIKFVFQPSEENNPGGALGMIEEGVLENPKVDGAIAFHVWNDRLIGEIGLREGPIMACTDELEITIIGKGGHGAAPHQCIDSILVASHVVTALQSISSRQISPLDPVVVTIGTINGGTANNVIAPNVTMTGTVRTFDPAIRETLKRRIERIVANTAASFEADYIVNYTMGYPPTVCDRGMVELIKASAAKVIGFDKILVADKTMGGEDMSYFLEKVPGALFFVGSGNPDKGIIYPHHHPKFNIDEDSLNIALEIMTRATLRFLET